MELKPGLSALITGGASGIGKALSLALARKGLFVTIVDFAEQKGKEVACLVEKENSEFHEKLEYHSAIFVKCDVTNPRDLTLAFEKHVATYGGLDICINSAGIGNPVPFKDDQTDGTKTWRHTINVNLLAVIDCTRLAIKTMQAQQKPGVIINVGSSAGLYPLFLGPVYSASKGGVIMFTRSLTPYKRQGIRVNVLCPEFVRTEMGEKMDAKLISLMGGFVPMEMVVKGAFELITDESRAGSCLWITNRRGLEYWPTPAEEAKYTVRYSSSSRNNMISFQAPLGFQLPHNFKKLVVHTLSHHFRDSTHIISAPLKLPLDTDQVLLKVIYAGVNAGDVNFSAGRYFQGTKEEISSLLPFDAGFEISYDYGSILLLQAVGIIAAIGDSVRNLKVGTPAALMKRHSQLAKLAGNKVVATCGGKEKARLLKELGVDRVIDYKAEDVKTALKEFPKGVDIVYESVGGNMFDLCLDALAIRGRLIVIGLISQYIGKNGWTPLNYPRLEKLLSKSQNVSGFVLVQYGHLWKEHLLRLFHLYSSGKLKVVLDPKRFSGLHSVADAVEYLHSGKSTGKVVVCIDPSFEHQMAKLYYDLKRFSGLHSVADAVEYLHSDFAEEKGKEVACLVEKENSRFHEKLEFPSAIFVKCDVTNPRDISLAFEKHVATYGGLDICINSAGINNPVPFQKDQSDGAKTWRHTINVNLVAIKTMQALQKPGVIINTGSYTGLFPFFLDPIYSGSKGGVVLFTRSLTPYKREGIRVNVLCPEVVRTEMGEKLDPKYVSLMGGFVPMELVVKGAFELITDESRAGSCLWISNRRGMVYWPIPSEEAKYSLRSSSSSRSNKISFQAPLSSQLPQNFKKLFNKILTSALSLFVFSVVHTWSQNFRDATHIISAPLRLPLEPDQVLLKVIYAGVNAGDAVGIIAAIGDSLGQMKSGKVVLVTAAAGGTGQFAVQLAKLVGNKVVATCGGKEKARLLKEFGVDRVIDYKTEDIKTALKEFPKGVDIVYECVGGNMFNLCLDALAIRGRLIVIGMISQYQGKDGWKPLNYPGLVENLLAKSQTVAGFVLIHYSHLMQKHLIRLFQLYSSGKLKVVIDPKRFSGLHSVSDAVEHLHSGKSTGKVVVCMDPSFEHQMAKL
ncbi:putative quinone oxidoreductase [Gossypium australe]|uniref:Putative quinone oxidoreductase n=1 Tax=Gossypium australe TaxID=47621 RepID=A0A5B6VG72_9ROSI|nr:putative quinone oxidoreductase [Gossypium australe]